MGFTLVLKFKPCCPALCYYPFEDGKHLTEEVKKWFNFCNKERFHQALEYQTPEQVYGQSLNLTT